MLRIAYLYALLLPLSALCSTNGVSALDMTSNVWGTSSREYRAAVFSALSEMRQQVACGDAMRGWFTNMVAYLCPEVLSSFPTVILPRLADAERQEMVSNITERAGLTEAEASSLEAYYGDIGNSGFN